jgi:hypothetical protein
MKVLLSLIYYSFGCTMLLYGLSFLSLIIYYEIYLKAINVQ